MRVSFSPLRTRVLVLVAARSSWSVWQTTRSAPCQKSAIFSQRGWGVWERSAARRFCLNTWEHSPWGRFLCAMCSFREMRIRTASSSWRWRQVLRMSWKTRTKTRWSFSAHRTSFTLWKKRSGGRIWRERWLSPTYRWSQHGRSITHRRP